MASSPLQQEMAFILNAKPDGHVQLKVQNNYGHRFDYRSRPGGPTSVPKAARRQSDKYYSLTRFYATSEQ